MLVSELGGYLVMPMETLEALAWIWRLRLVHCCLLKTMETLTVQN